MWPLICLSVGQYGEIDSFNPFLCSAAYVEHIFFSLCEHKECTFIDLNPFQSFIGTFYWMGISKTEKNEML